MKNLEWEYDETTTLYGSIIDSCVEDFEIIHWFDNDWESIKLLSVKMEELLKEKFYQWAMTQKQSSEDKAYDDFKDASSE